VTGISRSIGQNKQPQKYLEATFTGCWRGRLLEAPGVLGAVCSESVESHSAHWLGESERGSHQRLSATGPRIGFPEWIFLSIAPMHGCGRDTVSDYS
jgi:hypothetical protein